MSFLTLSTNSFWARACSLPYTLRIILSSRCLPIKLYNLFLLWVSCFTSVGCSACITADIFVPYVSNWEFTHFLFTASVVDLRRSSISPRIFVSYANARLVFLFLSSASISSIVLIVFPSSRVTRGWLGTAPPKTIPPGLPSRLAFWISPASLRGKYTERLAPVSLNIPLAEYAFSMKSPNNGWSVFRSRIPRAVLPVM